MSSGWDHFSSFICIGLQRRTNTELLSDAGNPVTETFLMVLMNGVSSWPTCGIFPSGDVGGFTFLSIPACLITECYCSFLYHLPVQGKHFLISPCEMRRHFLKVSKDYCGREFRPSPGILASVLNLIT